MSKIPRFAAYAAAFEKAYAENDWDRLEEFFTDDALYDVDMGPPLGGRFEGRDAVLAYFDDILNRVDRRFDDRKVELLEGPREEGDSVWIRGSGTYTAAGCPDFYFELEETAHFDGDRICRLEDRYDAETKERIAAYLAEHGEKLGISAD